MKVKEHYSRYYEALEYDILNEGGIENYFVHHDVEEGPDKTLNRLAKAYALAYEKLEAHLQEKYNLYGIK